MKRCPRCGKDKPEEAFQIVKSGKLAGNFKAYCGPCQKDYRRQWYLDNQVHAKALSKAWQENNKDRRRLSQQNWRSQNQDKTRGYHLRSFYGIGISEEQHLFDLQSGKCAICGETKPLRIDHDHRTGKVRGLLCHNCNVMLGHAKDSLDILSRAEAYLRNGGIS